MTVKSLGIPIYFSKAQNDHFCIKVIYKVDSLEIQNRIKDGKQRLWLSLLMRDNETKM